MHLIRFAAIAAVLLTVTACTATTTELPTIPAPTSVSTRAPASPAALTPVPSPTRTPALTPTHMPTTAPTPTPAATPTPEPTPTPTSTPTPTATPTPEPTPTPTSTPTPTATPTPEPTPTPHPNPNRRYAEEKQYVLELLNRYRTQEGIPLLAAGDNISAQVHAEISLFNCHSSLWSSDGLNPTARYTLSGGYQAMSMVVSGTDYCGDRAEKDHIADADIKRIIDRMLNPQADWDEFDYGILESLSNEKYRRINVGLTRDSHFTTAVFLLETAFIEYDTLPSIDGGSLTFSGSVKNGATLADDDALGASLEYHPPPGPLTQGQLARTFAGTSGIRVANLRRPASEGYHWTSDSSTRTYYNCRSPYGIDPQDAPPVQSRQDASDLHDKAKKACHRIRYDKIGGVERIVPWITADRWQVGSNSFDVAVDISEVLSENGGGVYTVLVWADGAGDERILVSEYSIFHDVVPTRIYSPR